MKLSLCPKNLLRVAYSLLLLGLILPNFIVIPVEIQIACTATSILIIGSFTSLKENVEQETMSFKDAVLFPVFGSFALVSIYLCYKFLPKEIINLLLTTYLTIMGVFALSETSMPLYESIIPKNIIDKKWEYSWNLPIVKEVQWSFTYANICSFFVSAVVGVSWLFTRHWILHNIFAIAFSIQAISLIGVGSFKTASVLLIGLFFYDIFWVFGTEVMVKVAMNFEGPAKIIFPLSIDGKKKSILGLGDIVIPGAVSAMTLRFDRFLHTLNSENKTEDFKRTYFNNQIIFYVLGLFITALVMKAFSAAQPALLYLVPCSLIALYGTSLYKKQFNLLWDYSEEDKKKIKSDEVIELKKNE